MIDKKDGETVFIVKKIVVDKSFPKTKIFFSEDGDTAYMGLLAFNKVKDNLGNIPVYINGFRRIRRQDKKDKKE